jgi:DNA-binding NarL/FixJ family response regulator
MPGRHGRWESLHILKAYRNKSGYLGVSLRCNKQRRSYLVHTLVAAAFHGLRPDGMVSRHRNGNQLDNRAENLLYGTCLENTEDRRVHGTQVRGARSHLAKLTDEQALEILRRLRAGESGASLAREFGVTNGNVSAMRTGTPGGISPEQSLKGVKQ